MIRSGYSFKLAVGHLPEVASRLREIGWTHAPLADRGGTYGQVLWSKVCKQADLRPVYGVELPVSHDFMETKTSRIEHWSFLARERLSDLNRLIDVAMNRGKPAVLTYGEACGAEGVIKIAHEWTLLDCVDFCAPDLYFAVTPATPGGLYRGARDRGAVFVACPRNVYPRREDKELYRVMIGPINSSNHTYPAHIVSDEELVGATRLLGDTLRLPEYIERRRWLLSTCVASMSTATLLTFESEKSLLQLCEEGANKLGVDLKDQVYRERLDRELDMIKSKNFEDYFFIIADMVNWAKSRMVVGPARGSSCGSLACYLLGITAIDPIPHGLIFERFIDVTRADLPDIDLDFSNENRELVFDYAERKYGDKVARLCGISVFQPRSALNRIGASLRIPSWQISEVAETAIKRMMGDSRKSSTIEDTLTDTEPGRNMIKEYPEAKIVARFEGHPDHATVHAAGLVVTDRPITDYVAVDRRNKTAMCNKYDAEVLNLLKIDVLGLAQLSIFERTMELLGRKPVSGWLEQLPLDDPEAFALLNKKKYCGIFQFTGHAMRGLAGQIQFESLDDIIAATALVRPGPMASGGTDLWVKRRSGRAPTTYPHPMLEEYMRETYGVMVYQEQVLRIGREVGDLSWADVTKLRQAMSKSLGKQYFDQFGDRWKSAAIAKGLPEEVAGPFWDAMCQFGAWAFNKAHSVGYAYVSYWCAWLKAHHPLEFCAASLEAENDPSKQIEMLRELGEEGIGYVPVDPEYSTGKWEIRDDGKLLGPLTNIHGIGPKKVDIILKAREDGTPLTDGLAKLLKDPKTPIDSLFPIRDRIRQLYPQGYSNLIVTPPTAIRDIAMGDQDHRVVIGVAARLIPKDENEPVKVARRGGLVLPPPTQALILFLKDDTDEILMKVDRLRYEKIGRQIQSAGKPGRIIFAIKGTVPRTIRMVNIEAVRMLGYMTDEDEENGRRAAEVVQETPA